MHSRLTSYATLKNVGNNPTPKIKAFSYELLAKKIIIKIIKIILGVPLYRQVVSIKVLYGFQTFSKNFIKKN